MEQQNQFIKALTSPDTQEVAFYKLLAEYKERLYWHIRKIVIDHEDADDALQNTFMKVFENINKFFEKNYAGKPRKILPTLHPAYLLRQPSQKKLFWQDFLLLKEKMQK